MISRQGRVPCPRSLTKPYPSLFPTMELRWGAVECFNPDAAVIRAEALARKEGYVGAVAFRLPAISSDATVIRKLVTCWMI